jgi:hypothetical protein
MGEDCAGSGHYMPGRMLHKRKSFVLNLTHVKYNFFFCFLLATAELIKNTKDTKFTP